MSLQLFPVFRKPKQVLKYFQTQEICLSYITQFRWNDKITCPHCGSVKSIGWLEKCKKYKCYSRDCHKMFTATTGTLFHSVAPDKLQSWFTLFAFFIRENFSSETWSGQLDLTQPNAWIMTAKLKMALFHVVQVNKLQGIVQVDEAYIGGDPQKSLRLSRRIKVFKKLHENFFGKSAYMQRKELGKRKRGRKKGWTKGTAAIEKITRCPYGHRTAVLGMHEQGGRTVYIVLGVDKNSIDKERIYSLLQQYIEPDAIVMTDDAPHYKKLNAIFPNHQRIRHKRKKSKKEIEIEKKEEEQKVAQVNQLIAPDSKNKLYSRKDFIDGNLTVITTNAIEARWKYIKLDYNMKCSYTREHMPGYLAEAAWRSKKDYKPISFHERFHELLKIALNFHITAEEVKQFKLIKFDSPFKRVDPNKPNKPIVKRVRRDFKSVSSDSLVIVGVQQPLYQHQLFPSCAA